MGIIFDTYALLAWFRDGDERYRSFFESQEQKFITLLILMEFYFFVYHFAGREKAESYKNLLRLNFKLLPASAKTAIGAAVMRSTMLKRKRKLSYTDCVSHVLAVEHGHKVLTGDEHFRGLDHVVFVE